MIVDVFKKIQCKDDFGYLTFCHAFPFVIFGSNNYIISGLMCIVHVYGIFENYNIIYFKKCLFSTLIFKSMPSKMDISYQNCFKPLAAHTHRSPCTLYMNVKGLKKKQGYYLLLLDTK